MTTPRRILVLYYSPEPLNKMGLSYRQHLQVLEASESKYQIKYHNVYRNTKPLRDLHFDAVIFHPTFLGLRTSHLFFRFKWELRWIKEIPCIKIAIPRDEYDHSEILDEWLYEWQISAIFCCFTEETWKTLYPIMHDIVRYYPALPGYIEERSAKK